MGPGLPPGVLGKPALQNSPFAKCDNKRNMHRPAGRLIVFTCAATLLTAQSPKIAADTAMTAKIRAEATSGASQVSPVFDTLTIDIGPRLTNSPAYYRAVDFVADKLKSWGLDTHREPWKFGRGWTLDQLTLEMVEPRFMPLIGYAEGWSPSTAGELAAAPVYLGDKTPAQIDALKPSLKGAIVMPLPPQTFYVRQDRPQPTTPGIVAPESLGSPPDFRLPPEAQRLVALAREAGAGVILRPNVLSDGTVYVTGNDQGAAGVPSIVLSSEQYNMIAGMIGHGIPVKLRVAVKATYQEADTNAYNVIAEIPGTDPAVKDQVVMLGAHLDSWHTGVGATDNADGVTTMMEAMRILKAVGAKPRRTIRVAIWGGEEQGLLGSGAWVAQHLVGDANRQAREDFAVYFNIDNGTGPIYGFAMENNEGAKPLFDAWLAQFRDIGARRNVNMKITSTDHVSFIAAGVPGFNPFQSYENYDVRTHHTNMDTRDHVNPEDIRQAAIVMASFAWQCAMLDDRLPRK
jgi:carboxypeptidase Q